MLRFGAVTIDVSHPKAFATYIKNNISERAAYTAVFNDCFRSDEEVKDFADEFGATIYTDLDEMIDNIDVGMVHCCNWDKHLDYVMHFVKKGKPVFVDKPIVGNMNDIRKLLELDKAGAKILGTSALRYCEEAVNAVATMNEKGIKPIHIATTVGVDDFNYAIHAVELISALMQCKPVKARYVGQGQINGEGEFCETFFLTYENGATATYTGYGKRFACFNTVVLTNGTISDDMCVRIDNSKLYAAMIPRICDTLEGKSGQLITVEKMVESIKILLACKASKLNGGIEVSVDDPILEEVSYDGYEFEKGYAATAKAAYEAAKKKAAEEAAAAAQK